MWNCKVGLQKVISGNDLKPRQGQYLPRKVYIMTRDAN